MNAIGAFFSHGPEAGRFDYETCVSLPKSKAKKPRKSPEEVARRHGLEPGDVGSIDAERFLAFLWRIAGRPADGPAGWVRERPLFVVLDNYSVHVSELVQKAVPELAAAGVHLVFLPAYSPELSRIEPHWTDVKYHDIAERSHALAGGLKRAVDAGLAAKAERLRRAYAETAHLSRRTA